MTPVNALRDIYVQPQSGRTIFVDTLRQASGGCPTVCSGENSADNTGGFTASFFGGGAMAIAER